MPIKKKKSHKKAVKKLTKEQKLKNEILCLKKVIESTESDVRYWKGKYDALNEKFDSINENNDRFLDRFANTTRPMSEENDWLRRTIELLCIPAEKFQKLEEMRRQNFCGSDPMRGRY